MTLFSELQSLDHDAVITLFKITNHAPDSPSAALRFSNCSGVSFDGNPYIAIPCEITGRSLTGEGAPPRPRLAIGDPAGIITKIIDDYEIDGSTLLVQRTLRCYLDDGSSPDPTALILDSEYMISHRTQHSPGRSVEYELISPRDYLDQKIPSRYLSNSCAWRYRSDECGYTGSKYWDAHGDSVGSLEKDACGKSLDDCRLRFGKTVLPFGGFPGLRRI